MSKYSDLFLDESKKPTSKYSELFLDVSEEEEEDPLFMKFLKGVRSVRDVGAGILKSETPGTLGMIPGLGGKPIDLATAKNLAMAAPRLAVGFGKQPHELVTMMEGEPPPPDVATEQAIGTLPILGPLAQIGMAEDKAGAAKDIAAHMATHPEELAMQFLMPAFLKHIFSMKVPKTKPALARPSVPSQAARFEEMARPKIAPGITEPVVPGSMPKLPEGIMEQMMGIEKPKVTPKKIVVGRGVAKTTAKLKAEGVGEAKPEGLKIAEKLGLDYIGSEQSESGLFFKFNDPKWPETSKIAGRNLREVAKNLLKEREFLNLRSHPISRAGKVYESQIQRMSDDVAKSLDVPPRKIFVISDKVMREKYGLKVATGYYASAKPQIVVNELFARKTPAEQAAFLTHEYAHGSHRGHGEGFWAQNAANKERVRSLLSGKDLAEFDKRFRIDFDTRQRYAQQATVKPTPAPAGKGISPKREAELKVFADRSLDQVEGGKPAGRTWVWPEEGERGPIAPKITADASTYPQWYRDLTRDYAIKKSQAIKALKEIKKRGMEADGRKYVEAVKESILDAMTEERGRYAQEILKERAKRGVLTATEKELYADLERKAIREEPLLTEEVKAKPGAKEIELPGLQRAEAEVITGRKIKKVTGTKAIKEEMTGRPEGEVLPGQQTLKPTAKPPAGMAAEPFAGKAELPRPTEPSIPQEILKKSEIIKGLREKLEIPVRTGRFRERAKGIYKRREQVVRLKSASDLPTLSHEIGHHIEEIIFPKAARRLEQIRKYQKEVVALTRAAGFPKRLQTRAEGFAEFIRLYITDPKQAQAKTPKFHAYFEGKMTEFPELQDILLGARRDIQRWVNQPATAKVLSQVSVAAKEPSDVSINRIYTMTVDDLRPIQVAVKEMSGGRLPKDIANDPFRQAWLLRGWTGKANAFLDYGIMDRAGNKIFPSFKEILKPIADDLDAFRTYGVAKRALERHRRGFETGIDPRDASASLAELSKKSPAYEKVFNQLVEFQDKVLDYLSESGVVGVEELTKLRAYSKDYLPFYRVFEETKVKGFRTGRGIANLADPVKRFKGSGREIVDPLESIIKNVYAMVSIAERNKVASTLVNLAGKTKGGGKWVESLPTPQKGWQFKLGEIERFLAEAGAENVDAATIARIFRPSIFAPAKENILTVFRHGKPRFYQVQPDLYRALLALDQESSGVLVRILSKPARMLRAGATLTPEFSLYRNPFRDQMTAFVYSKYGYRPGIDLARGLFHAIKKDDLFWKWQSSGGAHASLVSLDRNYLQGALRRVLRQKTTQIAQDVVVHPIETLRALSEFTEEATRIGEFKRGLEKGASLQEAALASRDVTLDFARVGAKGRIPNQLIAFFNAQVQGADKMVRSFKNNPTRSTVKAVAGITVPSLILYAFNRDNPRYKELPTWRKDLFWNIPVGSRFISIPKPFELGIIFGSFPERLFEWVDSQDPDAFDDLARNFRESLTPSVLPTALQPIIEVVANRSFFTGRPVVSEGRKRLLPSEQYSPYTPETFKAVGKRLGISPAKVEHMYRGYTAGLGRLPIAAMEKMFFNPPERPSDIAYTPMLRGIVTPEPTGFRSRSVDRFYDFKEKVNRLNATWKTLSGDEARRFREKHPEIKWNSAANKRGRVLSDLRKRRQRIMDNPNITVEEKKRRIKPIDKTVIKIVQSFLTRIKP